MSDREARERIRRIVELWQAGDEYAAIDELEGQPVTFVCEVCKNEATVTAPEHA